MTIRFFIFSVGKQEVGVRPDMTLGIFLGSISLVLCRATSEKYDATVSFQQ